MIAISVERVSSEDDKRNCIRCQVDSVNTYVFHQSHERKIKEGGQRENSEFLSVRLFLRLCKRFYTT